MKSVFMGWMALSAGVLLLVGDVDAANVMPVDMYSFAVLADSWSPHLSGCLPADHATHVSRTSNIQFCVVDEQSGVDAATLNLSVAGRQIVRDGIVQQYTSEQGGNAAYCVDISRRSDYEVAVTYQPVEYFAYLQDVDVEVAVDDNSGNQLSGGVYSFKAQKFFDAKVRLRPNEQKNTNPAAAGPVQQGHPAVISTSGGKDMYIVWEESVEMTSRLYVVKSEDYGETFTSSRAVAAQLSGDQRCPAIAADEQANIYVVWQQRRPGGDTDIYLAKIDAQDDTISDPVPVYEDGGAQNQLNPGIAVSAALTDDGQAQTTELATVHIVWREEQSNAIMYTRTTADYRDAWSRLVAVPLRVDDGDPVLSRATPLVSVSDANRIGISWLSGMLDGTYRVELDWAEASVLDGGELFQCDMPINAPAMDSGIAMALSADGDFLKVAWIAQSDSSELILSSYRRSADVYVPEADILVARSQQLSAGAVAMDAHDNVYVMWSDGSSGVPSAQLSAILANETTPELFADFGSGNRQESPVLAVDQQGYHFYVAWIEQEGADQVVISTRNTFIATDTMLTQKIDSSVGGSLAATSGAMSGARIDLPQDSTEMPLYVSMATVINPPNSNSDDVAIIDQVLDFSPGDTEFHKSVEITLPYGEDLLQQVGYSELDTLQIYYYNVEAERWEVVPGSVADIVQNTVSVSIAHFSMYAVGVSHAAVDAGDPASGSDPDSAEGTPSGSGGGSGGGGCFIATAAFGTILAPQVVTLCEMRDRFLLTNEVGRVFVSLYYTYSPAIADRLAEHNGWRAAVRILLRPLIVVSQFLCA